MQTVSDLEDAIWAELAWRKKELLQLGLQVKAAPGWAESMQIRAGITLLYAHWEGFVKAGGLLLVEHVRKQGLKHDELLAGYLAIAFAKELAGVRKSEKSHKPDLALTKALIARGATAAQLPAQHAVPTASNLSWAQFELIAGRIELRTQPFELLRNLIDLSLVHPRNTIAHGDQIAPLDASSYAILHAKVLGLLDGISKELIRVADTQAYRR